MQYGFYFDQTKCIGCFTCVVACKDWHDVPAGPASWIKVKTIEKGQFPEVNVSFLVKCCYHCAEPSCVAVCPVQAIQKRKDNGVVVVDEEACLGKDGCKLCLNACPYDAPQFGVENDAKMQKCDLCLERLQAGKKPVCVAGCPMRALDAGPINELKAKYGEIREAEGFVYSYKLKPSIIFKHKEKQK